MKQKRYRQPFILGCIFGEQSEPSGALGWSPSFFGFGAFWMLQKFNKIVNSRFIQHKINLLKFCQYCRIFLLECKKHVS